MRHPSVHLTAFFGSIDEAPFSPSDRFLSIDRLLFLGGLLLLWGSLLLLWSDLLLWGLLWLDALLHHLLLLWGSLLLLGLGLQATELVRGLDLDELAVFDELLEESAQGLAEVLGQIVVRRHVLGDGRGARTGAVLERDDGRLDHLLVGHFSCYHGVRCWVSLATLSSARSDQ